MPVGSEPSVNSGLCSRFRYWELVLVSLLIHKLPFYLLAPSDAIVLKKCCLLISIAVLMFALYANRRYFGVRVMIGGAIMNFVAIAANGGLMPVTPEARVLAQMRTIGQSVMGGVLPEGSGILLPVGQTRLRFFTDIIPVPAVHGVFSTGDVVMYVGALVLITQIVLALLRSSRRTEDRSSLAIPRT